MAEKKNKKVDTEEVDDRAQIIKETMNEINKKFGRKDQPAIMFLSEAPDDMFELKTFSSGVLSLDLALGPGGIPTGRTIEIYGPESSGKTTLAYTIIASAQKSNKICAFIDSENAFDPSYASRCGVNRDKLIITQPENGEQAIDIAEALLRSGVHLVIIDSVSALIPKAESDDTMDKQYVGTLARLMSKALRKLTPACNYNKKDRGNVIFINQVREKVGVMYGNPEITTGGRALRFFATIRIKLSAYSDGKIEIDDPNATDKKNKKIKIGQTVTAVTEKNKVGIPNKVVNWDVIFGKGIDKYEDLRIAAFKLGIITVAGNGQHTYGEYKFRSKDAFKEMLRDEEFYNELYSKVTEAMKNNKVELPIEEIESEDEC